MQLGCKDCVNLAFNHFLRLVFLHFSRIALIFVPMLLPYLEKDRLEAGCDEAGRGCLAGPVYAACVVLPLNIDEILERDRKLIAQGKLKIEQSLVALNDSKQLTEKQRYALRPIIERDALAWAVGICDNHEIDRMNILKASIEAMHRAVNGVMEQLKAAEGEPMNISQLLIDGNKFRPYPGIPHQTIVKGDGKMMSIAAASILAKTYRDDKMVELDKEFPHYGWAVNKGYPTKAHRVGIAQYGATPYHRMSFTLLPPAQLEIEF